MTAAEWLVTARAEGLEIYGCYSVDTGELTSFTVGAGTNGFRRETWEPLCAELVAIGVGAVVDELARRASRGRP